MKESITIPSWILQIAGPLMIVGGVIASYVSLRETVMLHKEQIHDLQIEMDQRNTDLETIRINIARLCDKLEVDCKN